MSLYKTGDLIEHRTLGLIGFITKSHWDDTFSFYFIHRPNTSFMIHAKELIKDYRQVNK